MPNWCHNSLVVDGEPAHVRVFVDRARGPKADDGREQPLTLTAHVPEPSLDPEAAYEWRLAHWGCKWDADFGDGLGTTMEADSADVDATLETLGAVSEDGSAIFPFLTPNSPPLAWLVGASREHSNLRFVLRWAEPGLELAGETTAVAGDVVGYEDLLVEDVLAPEELWY